MADNNFSVQLQDATTIIPAPVLERGPSPLVPILNTLSQGVSQFASDMEERARKKKQAKEDAEKERLKQASNRAFDLLGASNLDDANNPFLSVTRSTVTQQRNSAPPPDVVEGQITDVSPADAIIGGAIQSGAISQGRLGEIASSVETVAQEVKDIDNSIAQGNMPSTARAAAVDRVMLQIRSEFPDVDMSVIASVMEKYGVKNAMFRNIQRDFDEWDSQNKARRDADNAAYERGRELAGNASNTMTREDIIALGSTDIQAEQQLERIKQNLEIQTGQANLTEKQRDLVEREAANNVRTTVTQQALNSIKPHLDSLNKLIIAMEGKDGNPALMEEFNQTINVVKQNWNKRIEEYVGQVATSGVPNALEESEKIRTYFNNLFENMVLEPLENRDQTTAKVAKALETKLGLNATLSYPFIAQLKAAGVDMQLTDTLLEALDPKTRERLASEIANLTQMDMYTLAGRDSAMIQLTEVVGILNGNTTLAQLNLNPRESQKRFKVVNKTATVLTGELARGNYVNADAWVNAMAEVAVAGGQLPSTADPNILMNAMLSLSAAGQGGSIINVFNDLLAGKADGVDPEKAQAVALGTRAAIAKVQYGLINRAPKTFGAYEVKYNAKIGKWETVFDEKKAAQARLTGGSYYGPNLSGSKPPVPTEAKRLMNALNMGSNLLVATAKWDENAPKVTDAELRAWYNQGKVPKKVVDEMASQKPSLDKDSDIMKTLTQLREVFTKEGFDFQVPTRPGENGTAVDAEGNVVVQGASGQRVTIESPENLREKYGNKPVFKAVERIATKVGIPVEVALTLAGHEGKFNPRARADAGKGRTAYGPMQVVDKFHDATAMERYGKKVKDLSPEQNVDLGLFILAENYRAAGNWADAMAMYHSGVTLEQARSQNRSDGNIRTDQYIAGLATAAGIGLD